MQSTFMFDLQQVFYVVRNATRRSLVLLDEFGKGTSTIDGISLFCSTMEALACRTENVPRVLSSTHFHEIFHAGLLKDLPISFYAMEVMMDQANELTYLYRVVKGHCLRSWGAYCAASAGVPTDVIERGLP